MASITIFRFSIVVVDACLFSVTQSVLPGAAPIHEPHRECDSLWRRASLKRKRAAGPFDPLPRPGLWYIAPPRTKSQATGARSPNSGPTQFYAEWPARKLLDASYRRLGSREAGPFPVT